ncbi:flagellar hook-associated protein [Psychromonas sp. psych-6C06]|uniref:flagellar filament capping protein FliD n=1 Tax=Psychromonas sp. psych-6C06 TaxID=2058089 RepID=UPI000C332045|nr:flagellar filament capping protein FliD [Psychromonas sp. psych-6C06]PKF62900.1 flagellar hook-associated protein [Psychromonas sp. psych-6C06]
MSSITSTGLGSGLDINSIVTAIVGAEKDPALAKMTKSAAEATAQISAFGMLNSGLSAFKSSYKDLALSSSFSAASYSSSDSEILDAKLGIGAETGNWEFEVNKRAQAHTIVSSTANSFSSVNEPIGTGTISFRFGAYSGTGNSAFAVDADKPIETLEIDASNNSLAGMRDAINDGDYSVSASIINDGDNYRLVLTSKDTGEESAIELTVSDDDGNNTDGTGLSRFTYSASDKNLDQTSAAQDAEIVMNGITITRDSNEITSVIEGVTLNLNGTTEIGKTVKLSINQDTSKVEEQIQAFVDNYNSTITQMNELTAFNGVGAENGILNGDSTIRNIQSLMRGVLNTQVDHIEGSVHSFADLGLLTARDGTLELDSTKFADVLKNDMAGVADFFTASGAASDGLVSFESNNSLTKPGTYGVEVTQIATQGLLTGVDISTNFPLTIDADNDTFKMRVDGSISNDINLAQGSYATIGDLMTELQSKINSDSNFIDKAISVSLAEDAGKIAITSNKYGSTSNVAFTEVDTNFLAGLGFGVQAGTAGVNVEGKIDGVDALGDGQFLLSESGDSAGIKLLIEGGALGSRGDVTFAEGMTVVMNNLLTSIIDKSITSTSGDVDLSEGVIDSKIDSLYKKINDLERQEADLTYRTDKLEARLYKDFNAMDMAVSALGNTMNYLTSALDALPGYTRDN